MRSPTLLWSLLAAALLGSGPAASQPAQPSSTNYTIEEQEGDDGKPVGRRLNPDDADLGVENTDNVPKVARVEDDDPFFMSDDDQGKKLPPLPARQGHRHLRGRLQRSSRHRRLQEVDRVHHSSAEYSWPVLGTTVESALSMRGTRTTK